MGYIGNHPSANPEWLVDKRFGDFSRCRRSPGVFALLEVDDKNAEALQNKTLANFWLTHRNPGTVSLRSKNIDYNVILFAIYDGS
jgi:hypothetical protein